MGNHEIVPFNTPNPDKKHRRKAKSWKATSKRCHQYHRTANIVLHPGFAYVDRVRDMSLEGCQRVEKLFIVPFVEEVTYA